MHGYLNIKFVRSTAYNAPGRTDFLLYAGDWETNVKSRVCSPKSLLFLQTRDHYTISVVEITVAVWSLPRDHSLSISALMIRSINSCYIIWFSVKGCDVQIMWYLSSQILRGLIKQYFKIRVISPVIHLNTTAVTGCRRWCRLSVAQICLAVVRDKRNTLSAMSLFLYRHKHKIWLSLFLLWVMFQTWWVWENFITYRIAVTRYTIRDCTTEVHASIRLLNRVLRPDSIGTGIFLSPLLPRSWGLSGSSLMSRGHCRSCPRGWRCKSWIEPHTCVSCQD